jgi:hypothetical protein
VTAPAPVCSRHVAAGVVPDPGATSAAPAWWGDADWLAEVAAALDAPTGVELLRQHHVARDTALKVAEGRSIMTRAERLQAWRRGSSHRAIAATFALCSRKHRPARSAVARLGLVRRGRATQVRNPVDNQGARPAVVERDTPPGALVVQRVSHLSSTHSSDQAETRNGAARRAHNENRRRGPAGGADPRTRRLVEDVRRRLGWLRDVPAWRLALALRRFAVAGWTARDVDLAVVDALAARGWRRPAVLSQPAAYLALLLRELDPAERPSVLDDALLAAEAAQLAYERRVVFAPTPTRTRSCTTSECATTSRPNSTAWQLPASRWAWCCSRWRGRWSWPPWSVGAWCSGRHDDRRR